MITKETVLKVIHDHKTTSAREISKVLGVSGSEVFVVLGDLTQAEVSNALTGPGIQEGKLLQVDQSNKVKDASRISGPNEQLAETPSEPEDEEQKICPILNQGRFTGKPSELKPCLGKKCACYVRIWKPLMLTNIVADPTNIMVFEGCGLIVTPSWQIARKPMQGEVQ